MIKCLERFVQKLLILTEGKVRTKEFLICAVWHITSQLYHKSKAQSAFYWQTGDGRKLLQEFLRMLLAQPRETKKSPGLWQKKSALPWEVRRCMALDWISSCTSLICINDDTVKMLVVLHFRYRETHDILQFLWDVTLISKFALKNGKVQESLVSIWK